MPHNMRVQGTHRSASSLSRHIRIKSRLRECVPACARGLASHFAVVRARSVYGAHSRAFAARVNLAWPVSGGGVFRFVGRVARAGSVRRPNYVLQRTGGDVTRLQ